MHTQAEETESESTAHTEFKVSPDRDLEGLMLH